MQSGSGQSTYVISGAASDTLQSYALTPANAKRIEDAVTSLASVEHASVVLVEQLHVTEHVLLLTPARVDTKAVAACLGALLPSHLLPTCIWAVGELPLSPEARMVEARNALEMSQEERITPGAESIDADVHQCRLKGDCSEVLSSVLATVRTYSFAAHARPDDHLSALGFDSLMSISLIENLRVVLSMPMLSLDMAFNEPTVRRLAAHIENSLTPQGLEQTDDQAHAEALPS